MALFGKHETWKIVYNLPPHLQNAGRMGVALVEAVDRQEAMQIFHAQYSGQYWTVESCERLLG